MWSTYIYETYFLQNWLPRLNQILTINEVHPQLSNNGHPVDGWCAGGCWFTLATRQVGPLQQPRQHYGYDEHYMTLKVWGGIFNDFFNNIHVHWTHFGHYYKYTSLNPVPNA